MVNPSSMCRKHLLGEHVEIHMFTGTLKKKKNISGYIKNNLLEPLSISKRHDELVQEMRKRGYEHNSQLNSPNISYLSDIEQNYKIDDKKSLLDLTKRCSICKERGQKRVQTTNI